MVGGDLTFAEFTTESPYGTIHNRWERNGDTFKMFVTVPPNSQATVYIPTTNPSSLVEGGKPIAGVNGVMQVKTGKDHVEMKISAGRYEFSCLSK